MKRRRYQFVVLSLQLAVAIRFALALDDSYQSYIQALAYPARLVVRPDSSTVASDSRISFFCRADGNPLPNVVWKINGKSLSDSRFVVKSLPTGLSTLRIDPVLSSDNQTTVSCSADNGVANPVVADAVITVLDKDALPSGFPVVDAHPTLKSVEQGRTAHVTCRVRGDPRPKVLWLRDLVPIDIRAEGRYSVSTMGNPGALMIQQAREEDQGKYECVARNDLGVVHSKAAHLYVKVRRVPPYFSFKLEKVYRVGAGGSVNLTCVAVGFPMPRVFWKKSDDVMLNDPATAPIGKNVLTLTNVEQSENFTCVAVSKLGNIEATTLVEVKPLPPPPRHFRVSSVTSDTVTLAWEHPTLVEPALEYVIKYRQKSHPRAGAYSTGYADSNALKKWKVDISKTSTTIPKLEPFQLYEFVIATVGDFGEGPGSIPKEAQTAEAAPGSPPSKVQARSLSRDSVLVKWSPSERPNGLITGYRIFYTNNDRTAPIDQWETHETKSDELMATLYGLDIDKRYHIKIQARNGKGTSPMSNVVAVLTKHGIPGQPVSLTAKPLDSRRIQLSWEKPLFSLPVTGYVIWYNGTGGEKELTLTSPHEKHTIMGLVPDTTYTFRIAATSARGTGEFCDPVSAKTLQSIPTGSPLLLNVTATSSSSLHVIWSPPESAHKIVQYRIQYRVVNTENFTAAVSSSYEDDADNDAFTTKPPVVYNVLVNASEVTSANVTALKPFTVYEITVAAVTAFGYGPDSGPLRRRTLEDADDEDVLPVPSAPLNFDVVLTAPNQVKLTWDRPLHVNGHSNFGGYYVYVEKLLNGEPVNRRRSKYDVINDLSKRYWEIDKLEPNTEYAFRMNAFNRNGDGEYTETKRIVTGGIPPRQPEIQSVELRGDEAPLRAHVEWKRPQLAPLESPVDRYNLWYKAEGSTEYLKKVVNGTATSAELSGLLMGRVYEILLGAENVEGQSSNATEQLVTPVGNPEGEPLNVQYEIVNGKMRISWEPPAEDRRNGNITSYKAILTPMESVGERIEKQVTDGSNSATFAVDVRKAYTFKVAAATMKGLGPYSPVLTINPDPTADSTDAHQEAIAAVSDDIKFNMPTSEHDISSADVFDAIVNHAPGPLDIPIMRGISLHSNVHNVLPSTSTTHRPIIIDVTLPFSSTAWFLSKISSMLPLVGPPTNIRVEATSNSSAVVQWDFENGQVDGFVVKYMHEPGGRSDTERWTARTVMSPNSRHLEVPHLTAHKPYAFCVLAIKNNRQGACSDPPTLLERLTPTYMVQNLVVEWKTSNSVKLKWEYNGPTHVGFYLNHTGKKEYFDHTLAMKSMTTPGFKHELDEGSREYLWTNLRPYMQYTFHVGVRSLPPGARQYWPKEVVIVTDPTGPPFVFPPELDEVMGSGLARPGQIMVRLRPASEEYGPISHYWLIVVPGNYSKDDVVNLGTAELEAMTIARRRALGKGLTVSPTKKVKKSISMREDEPFYTQQSPHHHIRMRRSPEGGPSAYIAARIEADEMRKMYSADRPFAVGDDKIYNGFNNFPLEPNTRYRLMMRSFAKADGRRKDEFDKRAPMGEKLTRLYSDSALTEPFTTRAALRAGAKPGGFWLIGPLIALLIIAILIGMLVCWWLRCNKKSAGRGHRHGSITKVALTGNIMNGIPGETSKLLSTDTYGRSVMNPYEQMNGHGNGHMESSVDLYPLPRSQSRAGTANYAPVPVAMPCLPSGGTMLGTHLVTHPAVPISELAQHIERLRMNNNAGFQQEFESIETGQQFTWENSSAEMNKHKNRYANVVAYDHSRVVLSSLDGIPGTDYINANYIDGYDKPKAYIATQGPLPETFGDFWRMVWEEGSSTIVMLTNLEERSRVKCDQYWPSRGSSTYGEIEVTLMDTTVLAHYTMRAFRIQVVGEMEMREIRHLQYTAWPDHGVPDHPTPFLIFLKRVKTLNPPDAGPIISHCSAGIGRTGAFIVVDCMLERLRYENTVDIFGCVTSLRSQRSYMVQTEDQYIFIHDAVLDAVNSGSTEVPAVKLRQHVMALQQMAPMEGAAGMELEFRHLSTLKWANSRCSIANLSSNRHKNRPSAVVPYDSNRVIMQAIPGVEGSDYINASWVDGYRERCAYIATQAPTDQTVADFWRMVWEHDCAIIVMLTKTWEMGREKCCEYWPQETGAQVGQLVVEPIAEYNMREYILREFRLNDVQTGMSRTVRHFQFTDWPEQGAPKTAETFLDLIQQVHRTKTQFGVDGPIVVHCSSGAGRTGVFVALAIIIDRMRLEHVVDVFTTVKLLRTERQNMVEDKEQYHFLYLAAIEFLASFEQYPTA